jgi:hypothetical protein
MGLPGQHGKTDGSPQGHLNVKHGKTGSNWLDPVLPCLTWLDVYGIPGLSRSDVERHVAEVEPAR